MRLNFVLVAMSLLIWQCRVGSSVPPNEGRPTLRDEVTVTARAIRVDNQDAVEFTVANNGRTPAVIIDRFLPWGGNAANWGDPPLLKIDAFDGSGHEVPKLFPVREIGPDATTTIGPGKSQTGELKIAHYFDVERIRPERVALLRWSYDWQPVGAPERIFSGEVRFEP
jgi:hypothetical protein